MGKVLFFALALYPVSLLAQEITVNKDGSFTLKFTKAEADKCKNGGGCVVMPVSDLEPIIRESAKMMCGKSI